MASEWIESSLTDQSDSVGSDSDYPWRAGLPATSVGYVSERIPSADSGVLQEVACGSVHSILDGQTAPAYPRSVQGVVNSWWTVFTERSLANGKRSDANKTEKCRSAMWNKISLHFAAFIVSQGLHRAERLLRLTVM
jgi:hypothetical protein